METSGKVCVSACMYVLKKRGRRNKKENDVLRGI